MPESKDSKNDDAFLMLKLKFLEEYNKDNSKSKNRFSIEDILKIPAQNLSQKIFILKIYQDEDLKEYV